MAAGVQLIQRFVDMAQSSPADSFKGYLNAFLIVAMMVSVAIILWESVRRWLGPSSPSAVPAGKPAEA